MRAAGARCEATWYLPVIMLTAQGDPHSRVPGLELGADDYIAKPNSTRRRPRMSRPGARPLS